MDQESDHNLKRHFKQDEYNRVQQCVPEPCILKCRDKVVGPCKTGVRKEDIHVKQTDYETCHQRNNRKYEQYQDRGQHK